MATVMGAYSISPVSSATGAHAADRVQSGLERLLTAYVLAGLFFLLLPGTFLGVWNLVSISSRGALESLSPAWLQAHGHAQIFGWIGTFILGIGFFSLSKMGEVPASAIVRGWSCLGLWTGGLALRWIAGVAEWEWRILMPLSSVLELIAFLTFFWTVSGHRPSAPVTPESAASRAPREKPVWMWLVMASTFGFLLSLSLNAAFAFRAAFSGDSPALPHVADQKLVMLQTWGFLVPAIWGFNARWLPGFLGLRPARPRLLLAALIGVLASVAARAAGAANLSTALLPAAAVAAILALRVWEKPIAWAKLNGTHGSFPFFIRAAYVWLMIASALWVYATAADQAGGIWGAARHALTVGFISTMVFAIGPRILPEFSGRKAILSPGLMFWSLTLLSIGCAVRVCSEIPAYEGFSTLAWRVLPISAVIELAAVALFAANLVVTFTKPADAR